MEILANSENGLPKVALAIAVENPRLGFRIVRIGAFFGPLGHFGREEVEMSVAIHVSDIERVPVNHLAIKQVVAFPIRFIQGISGALVPAQRAGAITGGDDDLRILRRLDEFCRANAPAYGTDLDGLEFAVTEIFEPVVARK